MTALNWVVVVPPKGKSDQVESRACQNKPKKQTKHIKMGEELPILKGILKGNVNYHNARKFQQESGVNITFSMALRKLESERAKEPISLSPTDTDLAKAKKELKLK